MEGFKEVAKVINNNQPGWENIIETPPNVTLDVGTKLYIKKCNSVAEVVADLIQNDPHQFSKRPCATCETISRLIHKPFGCVSKAAEANVMRRPVNPPILDPEKFGQQRG